MKVTFNRYKGMEIVVNLQTESNTNVAKTFKTDPLMLISIGDCWKQVMSLYCRDSGQSTVCHYYNYVKHNPE